MKVRILNNLNKFNRKLRIKCSNCGHWNSVPVNKIFVEPDSPEPKELIRNRRAT